MTRAMTRAMTSEAFVTQNQKTQKNYKTKKHKKITKPKNTKKLQNQKHKKISAGQPAFSRPPPSPIPKKMNSNQNFTFPVSIQKKSSLHKMKSMKKFFQCSHLYHKSCINTWIETTLNTFKPETIELFNIITQIDNHLNIRGALLRARYGLHFPELSEIVSDDVMYARIVNTIQNKSNLTDKSIHSLDNILKDNSTKATNIVDAARTSIGTDIDDSELQNLLGVSKDIIGSDNARQETITFLIRLPTLVFETTACCPQCKSKMTHQYKCQIKPIFDTQFCQLIKPLL
jgi:RNA processing factor Prp31